MKKILSLTLAAVLLLSLFGCAVQESPPATMPAATETTGAAEITVPPETTVPQTDPPETTGSTEPSEVTNSTEPKEATEETRPTEPEKPKENTGKQQEESKPIDPPATESTQPATEPTDPPSTKPTEPPETQPPETQPPETQSPETEPVETEPPATEAPTQPTEPPGCQHDWKCIHHEEVGHWRAGIVCDCGWTVYGDPNELIALWNAHSASYPGAESLFDHGGYGSADEWIVDKPAYDEWVCRHCGEPKP